MAPRLRCVAWAIPLTVACTAPAPPQPAQPLNSNSPEAASNSDSPQAASHSELTAIQEELARLDRSQRCEAVGALTIAASRHEAAVRDALKGLAGSSPCLLELVAPKPEGVLRLRADNLLPGFQHVDLFFIQGESGIAVADVGLPSRSQLASAETGVELEEGVDTDEAIVALKFIVAVSRLALEPNLDETKMEAEAERFLATIPDAGNPPVVLHAALVAAVLVESPRWDALSNAATRNYPGSFLPATARAHAHRLLRQWDPLLEDLEALERESSDPSAPFALLRAFVKYERGEHLAALSMLQQVMDRTDDLSSISVVVAGHSLLERADPEGSYLLAQFATYPEAWVLVFGGR